MSSEEKNMRKWESEIAQSVKVLASMPDNMNLITQNLPHGGRRKLVQASCSLTSAYVLWCTHTHTHTLKTLKEGKIRTIGHNTSSEEGGL